MQRLVFGPPVTQSNAIDIALSAPAAVLPPASPPNAGPAQLCLRQQLTLFNRVLYHSPEVPEGKMHSTHLIVLV